MMLCVSLLAKQIGFTQDYKQRFFVMARDSMAYWHFYTAVKFCENQLNTLATEVLISNSTGLRRPEDTTVQH